MVGRWDVRWLCGVVLLGIATPTHAQVGVAALSGNVIDQAGASVSGATVTASEVQPGSSARLLPQQTAPIRFQACRRGCTACASS
jgi:hypothetical protein